VKCSSGPQRNVVYLTTDQIVALHDRNIRLYGGRPGVWIESALSSCVQQPKTHVFECERFESLEAKAAAYMYFITLQQPFRDGNKRTGFTAGMAFLHMNKVRIDVDDHRMETVMRGVTGDDRTRLAIEEVLCEAGRLDWAE
jgi:death-on-curing protein